MTAIGVAITETNCLQIEQETIANYGIISERFSQTRYRIWDGVKEFLDSLAANSTVLEIGCGNGKNMQHRKHELQFCGIEPCSQFIAICKAQSLNVEMGFATELNKKNDEYDASLSVAVLHHLSTAERRLQAVKEMIRVTKPGGKIFIEVWSISEPKYQEYIAEQIKKELLPSTIQRYTRDLYIPFTNNEGVTVSRFYHFYDYSEFLNLLTNAESCNKKIIGTIRQEKNNFIFNGEVAPTTKCKNCISSAICLCD